jgi:hypothetical protein
MARRRFGTGDSRVPVVHDDPLGSKLATLSDVADAILERVDATTEERDVPAEGGPRSLASVLQRMATVVGLRLEVKVEPRLAAAAAAGDGVIYIADRRFGYREALRLAVHEVLGHLTAAANGRAQPLAILDYGTAASFADQEGLCLWLEERAGLMDGSRLRTLAARVFACDALHAGASFGEVARRLAGSHGFGPEQAVIIAERVFRGGGVARDVAYLAGWLRVRHAIGCERASVDTLRSGRVGVDDVPTLQALGAHGLWREGAYRPSLARSLGATAGGTSLLTSAPSVATSLQRLELT